VTRGGDREELGEALDDPQDDRAEHPRQSR
jgi:hypothetical protein